MAEPIQVILDKCIGCKLCVKACMYDAVTVVEKKAIINEKCTLCGACVTACKYDAIEIRKATFKGQEVEAYSGICLFAEHRHGKLASVVP